MGVQVNWGIVPTWVRDGSRFIANASMPGQDEQNMSVWVVPATGGPPRKLRDDANAASVSRDGAWVAFMTQPGPDRLPRGVGDDTGGSASTEDL